MLVTSRNPGWQGVADPVAVDVLPLNEAVELLQRRSGDADERAATALAGVLDRLPLALEQAGAYTIQYGLTLDRYLEVFDQRRAELLGRGMPLAYHGTVDATFTLALDQLWKVKPAAVRLLELCALLAPDQIPVSLLYSNPELLPEPLAAAIADPLWRFEVTGALYQAGLLTRDAADTARMHRLVQIVTLAHLSEADRQQCTTDAVALLAELFPYEGFEPDQWPRCAQLLSHAQAVLDHARTLKQASEAQSSLLTKVGNYLLHRVDARRALELYEQALAMRQRLHRGDHWSVAQSMTILAVCLSELGEHERARNLDEQALAMLRRLYRGDHPDVAVSMTNLAADLRKLGETVRARELHEQAFAMERRLYGSDDHEALATSLVNLAVDQRDAGNYDQARHWDEQALAMYQRLYGGDHPAVARSLINLSIDLMKLGERKRARELQRQAVAMRLRLYEDQAVVADGITMLATDMARVGEYEAAREWDEQALAMYRALFDGDHPAVANGLANLASDAFELGDYEQARELLEQALAMSQRLYDGDHPDVANHLANLATVLAELGEHERARELHEQALAIRQRLAEPTAAPRHSTAK